MEKVIAGVLVLPWAFAGIVGISTLTTLNAAFPLSILWRWFVMPLGVPGLSVGHAMGLIVVASILRGISRSDSTRPDKDRYTDLAVMLATPWTALAIGWLVKAWWL